ncbi:hypothetical protein BH762_gp098 [Gordonia phage OneUp]|uniref:Uncharacterized protein n=1 Tax=Gordonia phage OneUp TaxID=1838074 RepID=A0A160DEX6_9CAUD|nr:hypothetical protein BH762_gp098 [Gordonia phage OneUp]ANA86421.1 hypothetical protein PBI_ONEUP_87 [Gordonia phage OneUp]
MSNEAEVHYKKASRWLKKADRERDYAATAALPEGHCKRAVEYEQRAQVHALMSIAASGLPISVTATSTLD